MHCGDDFAVYTYVELLYCTPESNIMLCVNYVSKNGNIYRIISLLFLYKNMDMSYVHLFFSNIFYYIFIFTLFCFSILYWFCHTLTWISHGCTWVRNYIFLKLQPNTFSNSVMKMKRKLNPKLFSYLTAAATAQHQ